MRKQSDTKAGTPSKAVIFEFLSRNKLLLLFVLLILSQLLNWHAVNSVRDEIAKTRRAMSFCGGTGLQEGAS